MIVQFKYGNTCVDTDMTSLVPIIPSFAFSLLQQPSFKKLSFCNCTIAKSHRVQGSHSQLVDSLEPCA